MRAYRLAHVAVEAETIRWKSIAIRLATRVAYGLIAALFLLGVLVFIHIAAWSWLRGSFAFSELATAGILGGVDLVIGVILGVLATRSTPSRAEQEALEVRRRAVQNIGTALSISQMAIPALRLANTMLRRTRSRL